MDKKTLNDCAKIEKKEHPWLTFEQARRIASDHLEKDSEYYAEEDESDDKDDEE